jgi:small subunit ribosomal protein S3
MGQKTHPIGFRLGVSKGWDSSWYGGNDYGDKILEDQTIRKYLTARIPKGGISRVVIERAARRITITVHTARPGIIIGKGGSEVDAIREEIKKITQKDVQINISEIKRPELDARLVGENIAQQIQNRFSYKRATKGAIQNTMKMGADGIKVKLSGRLNGAEMARSEIYKDGKTPLHTLRSDIDYAISEAQTVYGKIGVKVWICRGEIFGKIDLIPTTEKKSSDRGPRGRGNDRGGDRRRRRN